jgi:hypothetical protein
MEIILSLQTHILLSMNTALTEIGVEQKDGESPVWTMMRVQLLDWACGLEHPDCLSYASTLFQQWRANLTAPNPYVQAKTFNLVLISQSIALQSISVFTAFQLICEQSCTVRQRPRTLMRIGISYKRSTLRQKTLHSGTH